MTRLQQMRLLAKVIHAAHERERALTFLLGARTDESYLRDLSSASDQMHILRWHPRLGCEPTAMSDELTKRAREWIRDQPSQCMSTKSHVDHGRCTKCEINWLADFARAEIQRERDEHEAVSEDLLADGCCPNPQCMEAFEGEHTMGCLYDAYFRARSTTK